MIGTGQHPPYWFFGFQESRWGYESPDHIREVRERMKAAGIPQVINSRILIKNKDDFVKLIKMMLKSVNERNLLDVFYSIHELRGIFL